MATPEGRPPFEATVQAADVAAALAGYFSPAELVELYEATAGAARMVWQPGSATYAALAEVLALAVPDGVHARPVVGIVNDRDEVDGPFVLYANPQRDGAPVEVRLLDTGEEVLVVPPGRGFAPIPGRASGLAQRLYVTAATREQLAAAGLAP